MTTSQVVKTLEDHYIGNSKATVDFKYLQYTRSHTLGNHLKRLWKSLEVSLKTFMMIQSFSKFSESVSKVFWKKQMDKNYETSFERIAVWPKQLLLEGKLTQPGAESPKPSHGLWGPRLCLRSSFPASPPSSHSTLVRLQSLLYFRHARQVLPLTSPLLAPPTRDTLSPDLLQVIIFDSWASLYHLTWNYNRLNPRSPQLNFFPYHNPFHTHSTFRTQWNWIIY